MRRSATGAAPALSFKSTQRLEAELDQREVEDIAAEPTQNKTAKSQTGVRADLAMAVSCCACARSCSAFICSSNAALASASA
eukprot:3220184-Rhodomonas_salina.1